MSSSEKPKKKAQNKPKCGEERLEGFEKLREEQREMAEKIAEITHEVQEHMVVIEALKKVEAERKCFRSVGGILCERTVGEVLPALAAQEERLQKVLLNLNQQVVAKGKELSQYMEKYDLRIDGPPVAYQSLE